MDLRQLVTPWEDGLSAAVAGFEAYQAREGVALDWSLESLRALESQALQLFSGPADVLGRDDLPLVRGFMAYVGLALLRVSGATWDWDDTDGFAERARPAVTDAALLESIVRGYWGWEHFLNGACWYLGEMFRRATASQWVYRDWEPDPGDPDIICFQIQTDDDAAHKTPFRLLRLCLKTGQQEAREAYDEWAR
jgi:hypothetical protein